MRLGVVALTLLAGCGNGLDAIAWMSADDAFGKERWVLIYRQHPN